MKILIALCFEEGDPTANVFYRLNLTDGSTIDLDHEHARTHVALEAFDAQLTEKESE